MRTKYVQGQIWKAKCSESGFNPASQGFIPILLKVHVKMFTDFGGVWIRPWGLDISGWNLDMLVRSSSFLEVPSLLYWVLTFLLMGFLPTGVPGQSPQPNWFCPLEVLLELWCGKHSRPNFPCDHFHVWMSPFCVRVLLHSHVTDISEFPLQVTARGRLTRHSNSASGWCALICKWVRFSTLVSQLRSFALWV